ncbi:MAG: hypothetical protein VB022_02435 [Rikenellaceae bacterium]|nr:hypothetical protein [Rikenellaceae bacterium]
MESPFVFNKPVTAADAIPRINEVNAITERLTRNKHVLVYEPPKSGKNSLMQQVFNKLKQDHYSFKLCTIDLFNVRSEADLLKAIRTSLVECFAKSEDAKEKLEEELMISYIHEMNEYRDLVLNLSEALASKFNTNIILYFIEFQELLNFEQPDKTLKLLERVWRDHTGTTYLITGSEVNAMKQIFERDKYLYRYAERVKLHQISELQFSEFVIKNFLKAGRVVSRELVSQLYEFTEGHPYYTQQLAEISFYKTKGFMTEQILHESFEDLIQCHVHEFKAKTSRLSMYQLYLLKAIIDGVTRFSETQVMIDYHFNSSANVVRLKEATLKKEILCNDGVSWSFQDPIYKKWLKDFYF